VTDRPDGPTGPGSAERLAVTGPVVRPSGRPVERVARRDLAWLRRRGLVAFTAMLVLGAVTALSVVEVVPPRARPAGAPADQFSAARAFAHVERVGATTHVTGSKANDEVREYLVATLRGLGLRTEVQDGVGAEPAGRLRAMARVRNVVAVRPGTDSTGRVVLVAHYDSVQIGPGGNDDAAGVASILEAARALSSGPPLRNEVVVVLTDAEEPCMCGAEAFVARHPLAADGGVVLNVEARGHNGPVVMFETSPGNQALIDLFARAPHPVGASFAVEVYRRLPTDTDLTRFLQAGRFTGLNAAYLDGWPTYHTPEDLPSRMDRASLQAHGDNVLALTRSLGQADLGTLKTPGGDDATYFPVPRLLVRYPDWLVWPLAVLALVGVGMLGRRARRRSLLTWPRVTAAFLLSIVPVAGAAVAAQQLWRGAILLRPGLAEMLDPWRPLPFRLALLALTAAVLFAWYALVRLRVGPAALVVGALGLLGVIGAASAALAPGASYLATLPALAGAAAGNVAVSLRWPLARVAVLTLAGAVAVMVLAPAIVLVLPALGMETGAAAAVLAVLLGLALLPLLDLLFRRPDGMDDSLWSALPATVCLLLAVAFAATGLAVNRFDAAHPAPSQLMYALDADDSRARWVSSEAEPGAWTSQYVRGREDLEAEFPIFQGELASGPADAAALPPPDLRVVSDETTAGRRSLTLRLWSRRPVRFTGFRLEDGTRAVSVKVAGRELTGAEVGEPRFGVVFHAPPADGVEVALVLDGAGPVKVRAMDGSDGLAGLPGFRQRPPGTGVAGSHTSELILVAKTYDVGKRRS
jgi:hypothetical protein